MKPGTFLRFGIAIGLTMGVIVGKLNGILLGGFDYSAFMYALFISVLLGVIFEIVNKSDKSNDLEMADIARLVHPFVKECKEKNQHFFISLIDKDLNARLDITSEGYPYKRVRTMRAKE